MEQRKENENFKRKEKYIFKIKLSCELKIISAYVVLIPTIKSSIFY